MKKRGQYYRAGSGAVIVNCKGHVLAFERTDITGAWQMPQGGLDEGEEPLGAVMREVSEETGIAGDDLELLDTYPEPLAYELPLQARTKRTGRGQVQYWFLFAYKGDEQTLNVVPGGEFCAWKWVSFDQLVDQVVEFRRAIYMELGRRFKGYLSSRTRVSSS